MVVMVRRRSTVRFRKGAPQVSGVFRVCIPDLFRGFSRAGRRSRVSAVRIPAGHRPYRVQAGRLWRAAAGNRGARSSPITAGIADASLSPRLGVHVERLCCARRRALVAAFQRRSAKRLDVLRRAPAAKRGRQGDGSCACSRSPARSVDPERWSAEERRSRGSGTVTISRRRADDRSCRCADVVGTLRERLPESWCPSWRRLVVAPYVAEEHGTAWPRQWAESQCQ